MTAEDWHDGTRRTLGIYLAEDDPDREQDAAFLIWMHAGADPVRVVLPEDPWAHTYTVVATSAQPARAAQRQAVRRLLPGPARPHGRRPPGRLSGPAGVNLRTRLLVGALRRLPKPDPPTAAYLNGVRRELPRRLARVVLGPVGRDVELEDLSVPVEGARVRVRLYRRSGERGPTPLVVNFHGGGFVYGNLTASDWLCGNLAGRLPVTVASVDYRLAPEHPAPGPFTDCWLATRWLVEHAARLGCDPEQVSVMGESAGGNLAALVALAARDRHRADPSWPALACPAAAVPDHRPDALLTLDRGAARRPDAAAPLTGLVRPPLRPPGPARQPGPR